MLTRPDDGTYSRLTVRVNGGPNQDAMDSYPVPFTFDPFAMDNLTDDDLDQIVKVVVDRVIADHPDYIVYVERAWSGGTRNEPRNTVYTPAPAPDGEPTA
ncbi:hypothetical protein [Streptomyces sp. NPDC007074]|uniref:hypothetical protein n=1 Tax=Streptomyces sp. NPDC007074 TaxID=3156764 RepID=UPI0033FB0919